MAAKVAPPSLGVTTYSYGCPAFELQHIPTEGIPIEYSYGCPGKAAQPFISHIFL